MVLCLVSELEILGSRYMDPFVQESAKVIKIEILRRRDYQ